MSKFHKFIYGQNGIKELLGVDHVKLRKLARISKSSVSEYLRDVHRPSRATAARIAAALNLSPEYVLGQIDTAEPNQSARPRLPICPSCRQKIRGRRNA